MGDLHIPVKTVTASVDQIDHMIMFGCIRTDNNGLCNLKLTKEEVKTIFGEEYYQKHGVKGLTGFVLNMYIHN